jgi:hypothetical protein
LPAAGPDAGIFDASIPPAGSPAPMINYTALRNRPFADIVQTYADKDTILYALGVGLGHDPMDERQLQYVYEKNLRALPTMAAVLGCPGFWVKEPDTGVDWVQVLHGEQSITIHHPPAAAGRRHGGRQVPRQGHRRQGQGPRRAAAAGAHRP